MTNEDMIVLVRETWDTYKTIHQPQLTTNEVGNIDDLLDDVERLVRSHE